MKHHKENKNQPKEHDVETPSPPQVMDPSRTPKETVSKEEKRDKGNRSKSSKKVKDRSLSPNEEL